MTLRKISEREHIIKRPNMYIGEVDLTTSNEYVMDGDKIVYKEINVVPGFIKIINEIIDNSVDVAIKSNFKSSNKISVKMFKDHVEVQDNGTGIPVVENEDGIYLPELAWGHARAGSNFDDDDNRTQIGMNGVGSFATNCFSEEFIGVSDDGKNKYTIIFKDNALTNTAKLSKTSGRTGVKVSFKPDFTKFGLSEIDDVHQNIIQQRLVNLSMSFPEITFRFNGQKINVNSFKKYVEMFSDVSEIHETENYKFAILPNDADDFRQFSYVNGLKIPDGGTHIDIITNTVVSGIRTKLMKRYKSIKPGDIKNKLMVVAFLKNVKNTKFNSQSKEKITNTVAEINRYFGDIPFDKIITKILKTPEIIDAITEVYRIKEEFKKRQELKALSKTKKRIKSEKYIPSIGVKKYLFIVEGDSAAGGLMPVLGRKECGYYKLKGKPMNVFKADQSKFMKNKELTELLLVIKNEGYQNIIYGTDQDLDGIHIQGLLNGFIVKYVPEWMKRVGILQTPVTTVTKGKKIIRWSYNLSDASEKLKPGEQSNYYKGLGTWDADDLKHIVKFEGLQNMIQMLDFDSPRIIEDWLGNDSAPRKEYILKNDFSIAKA